MLQSSPFPFTRLGEWRRTAAGRRMLAVGLVVLIEGLLLIMLLSFGAERQLGGDKRISTILNLRPDEPAEAAPEKDSAEPERPSKELSPPDRPAKPAPPEQAAPPVPLPAAEPAPPAPVPVPQARPAEEPPRNKLPPAPPGRVYGPPDTGRPSYLRDTERVGTAPNGEPLYAAAWYEEPRREALAAYLSGARGPGWGLIACRTVPGYRVEDCVGVAEYPEGSQIMRAVLAAAWEFKVRPPRLGGRSMVGSWVRIRIDYDLRDGRAAKRKSARP